MLKAILFTAVLLAASVCQADGFFFYNSRGQTLTGNVTPFGGRVYGSNGTVYSWRTYPTYPTYPAYNPYYPTVYPAYQPTYPMVPAYFGPRW